MGAVRNTVNDQLLRISYKDPNNIRSLLKNWGALESLSLKGDTVAICILTDLKTVTGIDIDLYKREDREAFIGRYKQGRLSYLQYVSIAFVLVLGYSQIEVAFVFGVSHQAVSKAIQKGIEKIQYWLNAELED